MSKRFKSLKGLFLTVLKFDYRDKIFKKMLLILTANICETKNRIFKIIQVKPQPGGSVGWKVVTYTKRLQGRFPVRAHT